jgi:asparagine synthetase B (glutamine-hydrolysing)
MLVVYGPKQNCKKFIEEKVLPSSNNLTMENAVIYEGANYMALFWQSYPEKEVVVRPDGWIIGNVYWEDLPEGCSRNGEDLLDACQKLWRQEGVNFLKRLNGSFSICLHDFSSGKSLISTDRFSTYLLWKSEFDGGVVAVSPSYRVLQPLVAKEIDLAALYSSICPRRVIGNHSLLRNVKAFRECTAMCFDGAEGVKEVQWYMYKYEPDYALSGREWGQEYNRRLEKVIEDKLHNSRSPGCLMSGGIDSRLILTFCPSNTKCFTLADSYNIEMTIARTVAKMCGLKHIPIIRNHDWYPNMLEDACKLSLGLWWWCEAHFLMLRDNVEDWQDIDCVLTGCGFDTFFKAYEGRFPELWAKSPNMENVDEAMSFMMYFGLLPCKFEEKIKNIMRREAYENIRQEYSQVLHEELERVLPLAKTPLDAWEMIQFRSVYRMDAHPNLTGIRPYKASHNVIFDNRIYDMYFKVPSEIKRKGSVVRWALWERNKKLGILPNATSRMPACLPSGFHKEAIRWQNKISKMRNFLYSCIGYEGYKSQGSWPRIERLWAYHPKMIAAMDNLVQHPTPTIETMFNMDSLGKAWDAHKAGKENYTEVLNFLAGLGLSDI